MNNKLIHQTGLTVAGLLLTATAAQADQCQLIPVEQAAKALNHLKPASEFVNFCEPCGNKDFYTQPVQKVKSMQVSQDEVSGVTYWEISLNGKGIDLAYTFLRTADGSYLNMSKLADCPSQSVSAGFAAPEG
ncbi:MAG: hypothetical protein ACPGVP_12800 [Thiolinea sp.]